MNDKIDLIQLLRAYGSTTPRGCSVTLYGCLTHKIDRPSSLGVSAVQPPNSMFCEMEVYAVELRDFKSYLKQLNLDSQDSVYLVNGALAVLVDSNTIVPQNCIIRGRVSQQKSDLQFLSLINWIPSTDVNGGRIWNLQCSVVEDLDLSDLHESRCKTYISGLAMGTCSMPKDVQDLPRFRSYPSKGYEMKPLASSLAMYEASATIEQPVVSSNKFNVISRDKVEPIPDIVDELDSIHVDAKVRRDKFIDDLHSVYSVPTDYVNDLVNKITLMFETKLVNKGYNGRKLLKKYLQSFGSVASSKVGKHRVDDILLDIGVWSDIAKYLKGELDNLPLQLGAVNELCELAFSDKERFYAGIIGVICGIDRSDLADIANKCSIRGMYFSSIVNDNPYVLNLFGLSYKATELLATCMGFQCSNGLDTYRNIAILNNYCVSSSDNSNTMYKLNAIKHEVMGITLTPMQYDKVSTLGSYLKQDMLFNIKTYLTDSIYAGVLPKSFTKVGNKYINKIGNMDKVVADYVACGLGCIINDEYLISSKYLGYELSIYKTLHSMGEHTYGYDYTRIEELIDEYESQIGFKLEPEQRRAVHLCDVQSGVITGGAGAGKTTTADCLVYVLRKLDPLADIQYAAPTAKAAKRLQEVVKQPVQTMHSKFKLGLGTDSTLFEEQSWGIKSIVTYIFDECAMASTELLYKVLSRISPNSRAYFLGDINQLNPIGKGTPFKDMLGYMPCVKLMVSKRAAEGSDITRQADILNNYDSLPITSGKDFILGNCDTSNMINLAVKLCKYYLGNADDIEKRYILNTLGVSSLPTVPDLSPDDIQVVTPLNKPTYAWGAEKLNQRLQEVFNVGGTYNNVYYVYDNILKVGDRVIHQSKNMYNMQWYSSYTGGNLRKTWGAGICNGDVGHIVGLLHSDDCSFLKENTPKPSDFDYPDSLRDDATWDGDFLVVEYHDYMSDSNYYILYRCIAYDNPKHQGSISIMGEDLNMLSLFYAGTVHKLQGSQAKIIIFTMQGMGNRSNFLSRNMVYTAWTRGTKLVFSIGDMKGALTQARGIIAGNDTLTLGMILRQ